MSDADVVVAVLAEAFAPAWVGTIERLTGGASRSTWRCEVGGRAVIVQRQRADAERDMAIEAAVLNAAASAGVGVPSVLAFVHDDDGVATLITEAIVGETIARRILRDERFDTARAALPAQLGRELARIHRTDIASVEGLETIDPLARARDKFDELDQPHPAIELALRWLDDHRPAGSGRVALVHGDFRLGNLLVDERGLVAVLDWELAHAGDPMEDLGWLCVPAWRFGSPHPVAGVGAREQLVAAYSIESGVTVDLDALHWWEVCGIVRWAVICMSQADAHRSGAVRSHELAAIGRRVCENEHDLFLALEGRW